MNENRTACLDRQAWESAVKCLSQGHNRIPRKGLEPRQCRSQSRLSTALPTMCLRMSRFWSLVKIFNSFLKSNMGIHNCL